MTDDSHPRRFRFDPTFNIGHILTALVMAGSLFGVYASVRIDLIAQSTRLVSVEDSVKRVEGSVQRVESVVISLARTEERMRSIEARVDRIEGRRLSPP